MHWEQYVSAYDALFAFKNVKEKLRKSPMEINNLRRLVVSNDDEIFTPEKSGSGAPDCRATRRFSSDNSPNH